MFRNLAAVFICALLFSAYTSAQSKPNDAIERQIRSLNAEKHITVTFDRSTSKIMAVSENFDDSEVGRAGIRAMNFALGVFYPGSGLASAPDPVMLSFWVLSKRPRFAAAHNLKLVIDGQILVIGDARYAAKPRENMEYLNFNFTRGQLQQIAAGTRVRVVIGADEFAVTPMQSKLIRDFLAVTGI